MSRKFEVKNLSVSFDLPGDKKVRICDNVNLEAKEGEIIGVLGPNGSGKTTLLNAILDIVKYKGEILFDGASLLKRRIAYVPQNYRTSFFSWASLRNNLRFAMPQAIENWAQNKRIIEEEKEFLGIEFDLDIKPGECSGGMLQQAAILRSLILNDGLILADEPFSALDVNVLHKIRKNFRKRVVETGSIALLILHNIEDLHAICDRVLVIPNKPYSTQQGSANDLYIIKEFSNKATGGSDGKGETLTQIAERIFL